VKAARLNLSGRRCEILFDCPCSRAIEFARESNKSVPLSQSPRLGHWDKTSKPLEALFLRYHASPHPDNVRAHADLKGSPILYRVRVRAAAAIAVRVSASFAKYACDEKQRSIEPISSGASAESITSGISIASTN